VTAPLTRGLKQIAFGVHPCRENASRRSDRPANKGTETPLRRRGLSSRTRRSRSDRPANKGTETPLLLSLDAD